MERAWPPPFQQQQQVLLMPRGDCDLPTLKQWRVVQVGPWLHTVTPSFGACTRSNKEETTKQSTSIRGKSNQESSHADRQAGPHTSEDEHNLSFICLQRDMDPTIHAPLSHSAMQHSTC